MKYTCINIQGNLISEEILQKVENGEAAGQQAKDFGFEPGTNLRSEIEYAWSRIKLDWKHFSSKMEGLPANDPYGTSISRRWMEQFLSSLGFNHTQQRSSLIGDNNQTYYISHTADNLDGLPLYLVGFNEPGKPDKNTLDIRTSGGTSRLSPHATVQEYLNVTDHLFGIAANGLFVRLMRDSGRLIKLTYIEFDIKRMLDEDKYSEFTLLYRLLHASRFPVNKNETDQCLLEKYYQESIETGNRIRDGLSNAVKESLLALGKGFLQNEHNSLLREKILAGQLTPKNYYRQLLRVIYRLLFLMVTEERDLVYDPEDKSEALQRLKKIYWQFYSIHRLRKLSESRYVYEEQFNDLWQGLVTTFQLFEDSGKGIRLGIQPLNGDLFSPNAIADLKEMYISNKLLLECVQNMNIFTDENKNRVPINYRSLDVEELGSVYEGLLELHPVIDIAFLNSSPHGGGREGAFTFHEGTDRKTTGSYYTRPELVNELIKSALIPVIEERLKQVSGNSLSFGEGRGEVREKQEKVLLSLKVCDAAAGSGHMVLAAARTIAWYLARVKSGEDNPAPSLYRTCLREAIQHCIYAVDMNPDAVELCKLALWLESHNSGKPLSFLDHKIRCGNSLVGVTDLTVLEKGIPEEAYNPVTGDDKQVCQWYKKLARDENKASYQTRLDFNAPAAGPLETKVFASEYRELESLPENSVEQTKEKATRFNRLRSDARWFKDWNACNIWTGAFFYTYTQADDPAAPTSAKLKTYLKTPTGIDGRVVGKANELAMEYKFFHWPLEFPDVFEQGGFDVILGNPPWDQIQPEERVFFQTKDDRIAKLEGSKRKKAIQNLAISNPILLKEWREYQHTIESISKSCKHSKRFVLSAIFKLNTYPLFTDLAYQFINKSGSVGLIIPSAISTTDSNKYLFEEITQNNHLYKLYDFLEARDFFQGLESRDPFCIFILRKGGLDKNRKIEFVFKALKVEELFIKERKVILEQSDFKLFNPNTKTCPIFYTQKDYEVSKKIYLSSDIIINEEENINPYNISFKQGIFNMTSDSHLFKKNGDNDDVRLYEAKLIHLYNHRWASLTDDDYKDLSLENYTDSKFKITTKNYVSRKEFLNNIPNFWKYKWLFAFRNNARSNDERSGIFSIVPYEATGNSAPIIFTENTSAYDIIGLLGNLSCLPFDYILRQKIGGVNFNFFIVKQLPLVKRKKLDLQTISKIAIPVIELVYTSWDIKAFADDVWKEADEELKAAIRKQWEENCAATGGHTWSPPEWHEDFGVKQEETEGCPLPPFKWDEDRRARLKAELDAIYAKLYGLTTEELRYILDPQDVYGPDFPGETFRVLKEKEIRLYGEYRTRRLVLEAWERLNKEE